MIASADGRVAVEGRSVGLGHPADRALLRELRTAVDAILVGTGTLRAERYANLLDDEQRAHRAAAGLEPEPIVATISRRLDLPGDIPLLAEPTARVQVYTEAEGEVPSQGAWVAVQRFEPGQLTHARDPRAPAHRARRAHDPVRGRPDAAARAGRRRLRRRPDADPRPDARRGRRADAAERRPRVDPPAGLALRDIHRADDHLFLHYTL